MYKCRNNLFAHGFKVELNSDFHSYNTRRKSDIRKPNAKRQWGHWTTIAMATIDWNELELTVRESTTLLAFKNKLLKV